MALDERTLAAVARMRAEIDRYVADAESKLVIGWLSAWRDIAPEFESAARELADLAADAGEWPTRRAVLRLQRTVNALKVASDAIVELSKNAGQAISQDLALILSSAEHWQDMMLRTQLPPYGASISFSRVDSQAMDAIIRRSTRRIEALTRPLPVEVQTIMKSTLVRGVALGENPRATASQIMRRCNGAFNGGLSRARTIARTELLDAGREAARKSRIANRDVLRGWTWHATLSPRTCPSCLGQHGSTHSVDEPGPLDHQSGRCTAVPQTKSWRDLGIDLDEPPDTFPDARDWFNEQPREVKTRIMGPERLKRLESGDIGWSDLSQRRSTPGWRDSYNVKPL